MSYYGLCVRGMRKLDLRPIRALSNVYLDVLNGYVGYHSWDVTLGQVGASDFYMVGLTFVNGSTTILTCSKALLHAGIDMPTSSRIHQTVLLHSVLAYLQAHS